MTLAAATFPDVPGLVLEPMTAAHLDEAAQLLVDVLPHWRCDGRHGEWVTDEPCEGPASHARDALTQELDREETLASVLTFQGRALQYELIYLDAANRLAEVAVTLRTTRERPGWFWREIHRPLFDLCASQGLDRLVFWTVGSPRGLGGAHRRQLRAQEQIWQDFYATAFGGAATTAFGPGGSQRWDIPVDRSRFTGWPARRTVAGGWHTAAGVLTIREAAPGEFASIRSDLETVWGTLPNRAVALQVFDEWTALDRAAVVLGLKDGALRHARVIRERQSTVCGISTVTPLVDMPEVLNMATGVARWLRAAGYERATSFVPESQWQNARTQALHAHAGFTLVRWHRLREPFAEVEAQVP